jgi:hypothetical protein
MGEPIPIEIPQYALLLSDGGATPVVLVQAEETGDGPAYGLIDADGGSYVAMPNEVELLGSSRPS